MTFSKNHYEILGVSPTANSEVLRSAFRSLSKELHPDTTLLPQEEAAKRFQQVCESYELLTDPALRKVYDLNLNKENLKKEKFKIKSDFFLRNSYLEKSSIGERRPLSGGELFSLLLLGTTLLISLMVCIGFALLQGRELMVRPAWLDTSNQMVIVNKSILTHEFVATE